jgi:hypothetical protein
MTLTQVLLNLLFALLAGALTLWIGRELNGERRIVVIIALIVAVLVFIADLAAHVVNDVAV